MAKRKTPLERYIARTTDKRARYDEKKKAEGFVKTSFWVRSDKLAVLKEFVRKLNGLLD